MPNADNLNSTLEMNPTGDPELDELKRNKLQKELARISRNADRRLAREKAKGKGTGGAGSPAAGAAASPDPDANSNADSTPQKGAGRGRNKDGTARKCANCGQVGHIKTNRKSVNFDCLFCGWKNFFHATEGDVKHWGQGVGGLNSASAVSSGNATGGSALSSSFSRFQL